VELTIPALSMIFLLAAATVSLESQAQTSNPAAGLGVQVFPAEGQTPEQQAKDEQECYTWAGSNTGVDPAALAKQAEQQAAQTEAANQEVAEAGKGAGVKGAVAGAAIGGTTGRIVNNDDSKKRGRRAGALTGAAVGASKRQEGQKQATEQIDQQSQQAQAANAQQLEGFKNAFTACLEGKKYTAKY
jgi:hypothetical protein